MAEGKIVVELSDEAMALLRRIADALAPEQSIDWGFGDKRRLSEGDNWSNRGNEGRGWQGE